MLMVPFYTLFHDLAFQEMRSLIIRGSRDLPDGEYGLLELYCDDICCDCRRVIINIITPKSGPKIWATINYGWESIDFYERWMGSDKYAEECKGPYLDPLNTQTEYSPILFDYVKFMLEDEEYVERLKEHYKLFKQAIEKKNRSKSKPKKKRRLRLVKK